MICRSGCGACCIAPSIVSPLPGMPNGKPAGKACVNLDPVTRTCRIWGDDNYPDVCRQFQASSEHCGETAEQALELLDHWEQLTNPVAKP